MISNCYYNKLYNYNSLPTNYIKWIKINFIIHILLNKLLEKIYKIITLQMEPVTDIQQ